MCLNGISVPLGRIRSVSYSRFMWCSVQFSPLDQTRHSVANWLASQHLANVSSFACHELVPTKTRCEQAYKHTKINYKKLADNYVPGVSSQILQPLCFLRENTTQGNGNGRPREGCSISPRDWLSSSREANTRPIKRAQASAIGWADHESSVFI